MQDLVFWMLLVIIVTLLIGAINIFSAIDELKNALDETARNIHYIRKTVTMDLDYSRKIACLVENTYNNTEAITSQMAIMDSKIQIVLTEVEGLSKKLVAESYRQSVASELSEKRGGRTSKGENALKIIAQNRELTRKGEDE